MTDDYVNHEPVQPHTYTHLDPDHPEEDIVVCNDCGASAESEEEVQHYPTCKPGESEHWVLDYSENYDPEQEAIDDAAYGKYLSDAEIDRDAPDYYHPKNS